jgi:acylaminoacyl-peptidase
VKKTVGPTILVALLAATPSPGQERSPASGRKLTISDVFNFVIPSDPQISPDGKRIVYVRNTADILTDRRYTSLWIIGADGGDHRPLTTGNHSDMEPRWSPDGTRLAYLSDVDGKTQIYVRWMDSGQTARLTNLDEAPGGLAWSPDGRQIAFSARVAEKGLHVADLPAPPPGAKWSDPPAAYDTLVYRFNAAGYLKPGHRQIFVVSAEGGAPRQLTWDAFPNGGDELVSNRAAWSADGGSLLVSINRHPESDHEFFDTEIYEISLADGTLRALTSRKGPDADPTVSPNGKLIAYAGYDEKHLGHQTRQLYLMNRDGTGSRSVSKALDRDVQNLAWGPDGIYAQFDDQGDTRIGFYSVVNATYRRVAEHVSTGLSALSSGSFSISRNGVLAFVTGGPGSAGEVGVISPAGTRVLTALNKEILAQKAPGQVKEVLYESSKDHHLIQGWLVYPPDFDASKKYPLILEIHGGPYADYGPRFDLEKQAWASMGYLVFYSNPRGSTSYGEDFANLIQNAYPGDDYYDLESGVDAVLKMGNADPKNLFVTGGSGGGVLTCWVIEHTDRYRAAAPTNPVINWYSFALTTDIPFITQYWFPGNPWDHTDEYMQRSLTNLINKVKTPTLLMTGEADYRTPLSETEQFYAALKLMNVEAVLVRVPDEPHGLRRRPSHQIARALYIAGWFDQHKTKD